MKIEAKLNYDTGHATVTLGTAAPLAFDVFDAMDGMVEIDRQLAGDQDMGPKRARAVQAFLSRTYAHEATLAQADAFYAVVVRLYEAAKKNETQSIDSALSWLAPTDSTPGAGPEPSSSAGSPASPLPEDTSDSTAAKSMI